VLAKKDRSERDEALLWCGLTRALVGCEVIAKQT
jgi:hypothetical protein